MVTANQIHHRLLVVLSDLDMIPLKYSHVIRNMFVTCFWGIRYYCLRLLDTTHMFFYHAMGPTSHLLPCAMILTASFYFEKLLVPPLVQNFPRWNLSPLCTSILYFFVFSCQLWQSSSLQYFPLRQICISSLCHL